MWVCEENHGKRLKTLECLLRHHGKKTPVARLGVSYCSMKQQGNARIVDKTHFRYCIITHLTDTCVGTRVAIDGINYLPAVGLYNGTYSTIMDIE